MGVPVPSRFSFLAVPATGGLYPRKLLLKSPLPLPWVLPWVLQSSSVGSSVPLRPLTDSLSWLHWLRGGPPSMVGPVSVTNPGTFLWVWTPLGVPVSASSFSWSLLPFESRHLPFFFSEPYSPPLTLLPSRPLLSPPGYDGSQGGPGRGTPQRLWVRCASLIR